MGIFKKNYLILYKDINKVGTINLFDDVKAWYKNSKNSLHHNIKLYRRLMSAWSETLITLGDKSEWNRSRDNSHFPKTVKKANLWIDSTDFKMTGKRRTSKKSGDWSYKENSPGRRFMLISDGFGRVRKLWGPYSPKIQDGDFIKRKRKWFERKLVGGVVVGDNHFSPGRNFKKVTFHVPYSKTQKEWKDKKDYSSDVRNVRHRVESAFGTIKLLFQSLSEPFSESEIELDYLVNYACGIQTMTQTENFFSDGE